MSAATSLDAVVPAVGVPLPKANAAARIGWELWVGALAVTSSVIGMEWDIAWHVSIGRDTFWTPAHMMIQLCGVLTAIVCGYLVVSTTFGGSRDQREHSIRVFGLYGPLGCFLAIWGGLAIVVSAPFDNWWHDAYGLDVQIVSPPHALLFLGLRMICFGFLVMIIGAMNRAAAEGTANFKPLQRLLLYMGGLIVTGHMLLLTQATDQSSLHSSAAYKDTALAMLAMLPLLWQASRHRWAATWAAGIYTVIRIAEVLIFPLFPATPKLGPILNPVTHLVPAQFPILILVPAIALDLFWQHAGHLRPWLLSALSGVLFIGTMAAVEWPFATFLATPAAQNRFFGAGYYGYNTPEIDRHHRFWFGQSGWPLWHGLLIAVLCAMITSWIGLQAGRWLRSVER